ncbi:MAG: hypothetical protein E4H38_02065 [Gemmatimonadales bacterium]|nr:MAG: hypothetical protein E4H38_02065 [Gemmatimonadales bacterium]
MSADQNGLRDGIAVGFIAYACVAVFYGLFDILAARGALYTVNLLGLAVFRGVRDPGVTQLPIPLDAMAIFWYNAMHLTLSLAIGLFVTRLVGQAERNPSQRGAILFVIVAGFVTTVYGVGLLSTPIRPVLPWWSIVVANALATALAARYLVRKRPGLLGRLMPFAG